eukprot:gene403-378_t
MGKEARKKGDGKEGVSIPLAISPLVVTAVGGGMLVVHGACVSAGLAAEVLIELFGMGLMMLTAALCIVRICEIFEREVHRDPERYRDPQSPTYLPRPQLQSMHELALFCFGPWAKTLMEVSLILFLTGVASVYHLGLAISTCKIIPNHDGTISFLILLSRALDGQVRLLCYIFTLVMMPLNQMRNLAFIAKLSQVGVAGVFMAVVVLVILAFVQCEKERTEFITPLNPAPWAGWTHSLWPVARVVLKDMPLELQNEVRANAWRWFEAMGTATVFTYGVSAPTLRAGEPAISQEERARRAEALVGVSDWARSVIPQGSVFQAKQPAHVILKKTDSNATIKRHAADSNSDDAPRDHLAKNPAFDVEEVEFVNFIPGSALPGEVGPAASASDILGPVKINFAGMLPSFAGYCFAFYIPDIRAELQDKREMPRVTKISVCLMFCFYLTVALAGFMAMGRNSNLLVDNMILNSLPPLYEGLQGWGSALINIFIMAKLVIAYPLIMYIVLRRFEEYAFRYFVGDPMQLLKDEREAALRDKAAQIHLTTCSPKHAEVDQHTAEVQGLLASGCGPDEYKNPYLQQNVGNGGDSGDSSAAACEAARKVNTNNNNRQLLNPKRAARASNSSQLSGNHSQLSESLMHDDVLSSLDLGGVRRRRGSADMRTPGGGDLEAAAGSSRRRRSLTVTRNHHNSNLHGASECGKSPANLLHDDVTRALDLPTPNKRRSSGGAVIAKHLHVDEDKVSLDSDTGSVVVHDVPYLWYISIPVRLFGVLLTLGVVEIYGCKADKMTILLDFISSLLITTMCCIFPIIGYRFAVFKFGPLRYDKSGHAVIQEEPARFGATRKKRAAASEPAGLAVAVEWGWHIFCVVLTSVVTVYGVWENFPGRA